MPDETTNERKERRGPAAPTPIHALTPDELNAEAGGTYTGSVSDAWPLVERMNAAGNPIRAFGFNVASKAYVCRFDPYEAASDSDPAVAIVRAYVKATRAKNA